MESITITKEMLAERYNTRQSSFRDNANRRLSSDFRDHVMPYMSREKLMEMIKQTFYLKCSGCKEPFREGELAYAVRLGTKQYVHADRECISKINPHLLTRDLKQLLDITAPVQPQ